MVFTTMWTLAVRSILLDLKYWFTRCETVAKNSVCPLANCSAVSIDFFLPVQQKGGVGPKYEEKEHDGTWVAFIGLGYLIKSIISFVIILITFITFILEIMFVHEFGAYISTVADSRSWPSPKSNARLKSPTYYFISRNTAERYLAPRQPRWQRSRCVETLPGSRSGFFARWDFGVSHVCFFHCK